ncbi:MAG: DUF4293 domain-containing protein [Cryomorphaceae bacterium]|nr:DUF4293 domain-containing protein [Flavobacteriales bacterium]
MIQRVQTIYLFLALLAGLATFFLPFAHYLSGDVKIGEFAMFGVFNVQSDMLEMTNPYPFPTYIFGILISIIPLIAILLFKKRPVQMKVTRLGFLVNLGFVVFLFFAIDKINESVFDSTAEVLHHSGFYLPIAAMVFLFLAVRGIKKDEALVRSLDRIR